MSSYITMAKNPKTGKKVKAFFIDDYYRPHEYGVGFRKDNRHAEWGDKFEDCDFYPEDKIEKDY